MNNINIAFIFTIIAGLSTLIGTIPIFIKFKNIDKIIASSLSLAAGVMLSISIFDLIPSTFNILSKYYNSITIIILALTFIIIGIIISSILSIKLDKYNSLYKVGIISMLGIIIHNIPEGIITFISTSKSTTLGISLAIAISLHNIPEGISISIPIYYSTNNKTKAFNYALIAALSEPFAGLLTYLFLSKYINNTILGLLFSLIAGLMIDISLIRLLPESLSNNNPKLTKIFFILGLFIMIIVLSIT